MMKSMFNLSHEKLLTCNMGDIVPITWYDASPGDVFRGNTSLLVRTQPLLAPVMHKVDCFIAHYFIPNRLLWSEWENFINGGLDGTQAPTRPTITFATGPGISTLADYLDVPPKMTGFNTDGIVVDARPFRAYGLVYNEWFRDQQLNTPVTVSTASGADVTTNTSLKKACWNKDYFTAARPEPQLGTEVTIPLTGDAPVVSDGTEPTFKSATLATGSHGLRMQSGANTTTYDNNPGATATDIIFDDTGLEADLSSVSAVNINDLRTASALQRFKEKTNRMGARYVEWLASMFGVRVQDSRLQLPEYLGGGNVTIQFSEVLQTAEGTDPVGELRGHGIAAGKSNRFKYFVPEHGIIMTCLVVRPKTVYAQGLNKKWNRSSPYDFLIPDFAHLGDQAVLNKEVYAAAASPNSTFGFVPRYDEYRTIPNTIAGEFRDTLDYWHMARIFDSEPALNAAFVSADPTDRIYATDAAQLQVRAMHSIKAKRLLPKKANPRLM